VNPADLSPREAGAEALRREPGMLARIRNARHLPESDPRRVAALAEKQLVLDLIARSEERDEAGSE